MRLLEREASVFTYGSFTFLKQRFPFFVALHRDVKERYHNPSTVDEESSLRYLKCFVLVSVLYRCSQEGV